MDILLLFSVPQISCPIRTACFLWSIATQHFMPLKKVSLCSVQPYNFFVRHLIQKFGKYGFRLLRKFIAFIMSVIRPVRWQHLKRWHKSYFDTCPPDYTYYVMPHTLNKVRIFFYRLWKLIHTQILLQSDII